jgi:hypothetical protein
MCLDGCTAAWEQKDCEMAAGCFEFHAVTAQQQKHLACVTLLASGWRQHLALAMADCLLLMLQLLCMHVAVDV